MEALKNLDMDLLVTQWNRYCDITNSHERDYYSMDELKDILQGIDDRESVLVEDFDEEMPYFTEDSNGMLRSTDSLNDSYIEELYRYLTEE